MYDVQVKGNFLKKTRSVDFMYRFKIVGIRFVIMYNGKLCAVLAATSSQQIAVKY